MEKRDDVGEYLQYPSECEDVLGQIKRSIMPLSTSGTSMHTEVVCEVKHVILKPIKITDMKNEHEHQSSHIANNTISKQC